MSLRKAGGSRRGRATRWTEPWVVISNQQCRRPSLKSKHSYHRPSCVYKKKTDVTTIGDAISFFWSSFVRLFVRHFLLVQILVCCGTGANERAMAAERDVTKGINTRPRPSPPHSSPQRPRQHSEVLPSHRGIDLKVTLHLCEFIVYLLMFWFCLKNKIKKDRHLRRSS